MTNPANLPPIPVFPARVSRRSRFARGLALALALGFLGSYVLLLAGQIRLPAVHSAEGGSVAEASGASPGRTLAGYLGFRSRQVHGGYNPNGETGAHHAAIGCGGSAIPVPKQAPEASPVTSEDT